MTNEPSYQGLHWLPFCVCVCFDWTPVHSYGHIKSKDRRVHFRHWVMKRFTKYYSYCIINLVVEWKFYWSDSSSKVNIMKSCLLCHRIVHSVNMARSRYIEYHTVVLISARVACLSPSLQVIFHLRTPIFDTTTQFVIIIWLARNLHSRSKS